MENIKLKITEAIDLLCEKYKDDPYMISKTENFISNQLPLVLQNIEKNHADRVQRERGHCRSDLCGQEDE